MYATPDHHSADEVRGRALIVHQNRHSTPMTDWMVPLAPSDRHLRSSPAGGLDHAQSQRDS